MSSSSSDSLRGDIRDLVEAIRALSITGATTNNFVINLPSIPPLEPTSTATSGLVSSAQPTTVSSDSQTTLSSFRSPTVSRLSAERHEWALKVGDWLKRGLEGHVGPSNRKENSLQSRLFVVVRDFAGQVHSPVLIFRTLSAARAVVQKPGSCPANFGNSLFIGFPSKEEARIAVTQAGLEFPSNLE